MGEINILNESLKKKNFIKLPKIESFYENLQ